MLLGLVARGCPVVMCASEPPPVAAQVSQLAQDMRRKIEDAEEELHVEVVHSKKFLLRGDGLRMDFARAGARRRRALLQGAVDNEKALLAAMVDAEEAGLPKEYMEEAIRVANSLAVARAEIEADDARSASSGGGGDGLSG